jgi:hypothetical protein
LAVQIRLSGLLRGLFTSKQRENKLLSLSGSSSWLASTHRQAAADWKVKPDAARIIHLRYRSETSFTASPSQNKTSYARSYVNQGEDRFLLSASHCREEIKIIIPTVDEAVGATQDLGMTNTQAFGIKSTAVPTLNYNFNVYDIQTRVEQVLGSFRPFLRLLYSNRPSDITKRGKGTISFLLLVCLLNFFPFFFAIELPFRSERCLGEINVSS